MEARSLQYIAEACGGAVTAAARGRLALGLSTDSRMLQPGEIFAALPGDNFDGHNYLEAAAQAGASAVLVEETRRPTTFESCPVIAVANSRAALGRIAAQYRTEFSPLVVAVGGSNGKTSTKELVASVLRSRWKVVWSEASFNNDIGVPLTLLKIEREHRAAVLEVGTNHPGEMAPLLQMVRPRYGIITNIGREHLEFFGDIDGVAHEEGAMAEALPANGALFLNGDSPWAPKLAQRTTARVIRVGFDAGNDWRALDVQMDESGLRFLVRAPKPAWNGEYTVPLLGRHQVVNALFAIAVGAENRFSRAEIQSGLHACPQPKMRMQPQRVGGVLWLNDSYNANPDSVQAALQTLKELPCPGRRVVVLGDMLELGPTTEAAHIEAAQMAGASGVDALYAVGQWASATARAALGRINLIKVFADAESAGRALVDDLRGGDVVLLKASRGARLERVERFWSEQRSKGDSSIL